MPRRKIKKAKRDSVWFPMRPETKTANSVLICVRSTCTENHARFATGAETKRRKRMSNEATSEMLKETDLVEDRHLLHSECLKLSGSCTSREWISGGRNGWSCRVVGSGGGLGGSRGSRQAGRQVTTGGKVTRTGTESLTMADGYNIG